jgi:hypothetical protein
MVLFAAREIVTKPPTEFGYSDVGDVIVALLRGEKTAAEALESLRNLNKDYERKRRPRPTLPVIVIAGTRATRAKIVEVFTPGGRFDGWSRTIRAVQHDRDLDQLRGLRGPDVWWVDWGATQEMKNFAAIHEFKQTTSKECSDAIEAYIAATR